MQKIFQINKGSGCISEVSTKRIIKFINSLNLFYLTSFQTKNLLHLQKMPYTTRSTRHSKAKSERRENYKKRMSQGKKSKWVVKPKGTKHRVKPMDSDNVSAVVVGHGQTYVRCNPLPPPPSHEEVYKKYVNYVADEQTFIAKFGYSQWKNHKHKYGIVNPFRLYSQYCENYEDSLKTPWIVID